MRMTLWLFVAALLLRAVSGCVSSVKEDPFFKPGQGDTLTEGELSALTWHARQFVASSKHVRLTPAARRFVRETQPSVQIRYLAPKHGKIRITWRLTPVTLLILTGTGPLTRKEFPWGLEINTTATTHPVPPGFLKGVPESPESRSGE